jgi:hypothetical protein
VSTGPCIILRVSPDGQTQLRTEGFSGSACLQASGQLERALGLAGQRQHTAEFYQAQASTGHQQQAAGGPDSTSTHQP